MRAWLLYFLCSIAVLPGSTFGAEEKPKYRCLAPFVWELQSNRAPANLFEAFLSGPFDRIPSEGKTSEEIIEEGWNVYFDGDWFTAHRWFREAWHRDEAAEALVALASTHWEDPFRQVFAKEAKQRLAPNDPLAALMEIIISEEETLKERELIELWLVRNPEYENISLLVLQNSMALSNPPGDGYLPVLQKFFERNPEWQLPRLKLAATVGDRELLMTKLREAAGNSSRPGVLREGLKSALEIGALEHAVPLSRKLLAAEGPVEYFMMIDLAWRLDQRDAAMAWLEKWEDELPIPKELAGIRPFPSDWRKRLGNGDALSETSSVDAADFIGDASPGDASPGDASPGHLRAMIRKIESDFKKGDLRSALYSIDADLARAVRGSDHAEAFTQVIAPVLKQAGRSEDDWLAVEPLSVPVPPDSEVFLPSTILESVASDRIDLSVPGRKANLILFYSGIGCPACQVELQAFNQLAGEFEKLGIDIFAVSPQSAEDVGQALRTSGLRFPFTFCSDPELGAFEELTVYDQFEEYPLHGAVLIGKGGEVLFTVRGYAPVTDAGVVLKSAQHLVGRMR